MMEKIFKCWIQNTGLALAFYWKPYCHILLCALLFLCTKYSHCTRYSAGSEEVFCLVRLSHIRKSETSCALILNIPYFSSVTFSWYKSSGYFSCRPFYVHLFLEVHWNHKLYNFFTETIGLVDLALLVTDAHLHDAILFHNDVFTHCNTFSRFECWPTWSENIFLKCFVCWICVAFPFVAFARIMSLLWLSDSVYRY